MAAGWPCSKKAAASPHGGERFMPAKAPCQTTRFSGISRRAALEKAMPVLCGISASRDRI